MIMLLWVEPIIMVQRYHIRSKADTHIDGYVTM